MSFDEASDRSSVEGVLKGARSFTTLTLLNLTSHFSIHADRTCTTADFSTTARMLSFLIGAWKDHANWGAW